MTDTRAVLIETAMGRANDALVVLVTELDRVLRLASEGEPMDVAGLPAAQEAVRVAMAKVEAVGLSHRSLGR